jgi:hypothetical protein
VPIGRELLSPFLAGVGDAAWEQWVPTWFEFQREVSSAWRAVASNASASRTDVKRVPDRVFKSQSTTKPLHLREMRSSAQKKAHEPKRSGAGTPSRPWARIERSQMITSRPASGRALWN